MKIEYDQNPLKTKVLLDDRDKLYLKASLTLEHLWDELYRLAPDKFQEIDDKIEKAVENQIPYFLGALDGEEHSGDCTSVPCSCLKCQAEYYIGVDTLKDLRQPYYVEKAFNQDGVKTIDQAILWLKDNPVKPTWEGSEKHVPRWQAEQERALEDLIKYKEKYLG